MPPSAAQHGHMRYLFLEWYLCLGGSLHNCAAGRVMQPLPQRQELAVATNELSYKHTLKNLYQPFCLLFEKSGSALNVGQHICSVIKCLIMGCSGSTQM